jgi:hypothetical protein
MAKNNQSDIIREQMQANRRIIKAAASSKTGQFVARSPLSERIKQFTQRDAASTQSSPHPPRSKK